MNFVQKKRAESFFVSARFGLSVDYFIISIAYRRKPDSELRSLVSFFINVLHLFVGTLVLAFLRFHTDKPFEDLEKNFNFSISFQAFPALPLLLPFSEYAFRPHLPRP